MAPEDNGTSFALSLPNVITLQSQRHLVEHTTFSPKDGTKYHDLPRLIMIYQNLLLQIHVMEGPFKLFLQRNSPIYCGKASKTSL